MWTRQLIVILAIVVAAPALAEAQLKLGPKLGRKVLEALGKLWEVPTSLLSTKTPVPVEATAEAIAEWLSKLPADQRHRLLSELPVDQRYQWLSWLRTERHRLLSELPADQRPQWLSEYRLLSKLPTDQRHQLFNWLSADQTDRTEQRGQQRPKSTANRNLSRIPRSDSACGPGRDCIPTVGFSDGQMTFSVECAGEKVSVKFPLSLSLPTSETVEALFWLSIMNSTNPAWFEAYLAQFPTGVFRALAEVRLATLRASADAPPRVSGPQFSRPARVTSSDLQTPPEFGADWQRAFSVGCGALTFDVSIATGKVKFAVLGTFSFGSDGQATFSAKHGYVSFDASVGVATASPTGQAVAAEDRPGEVSGI